MKHRYVIVLLVLGLVATACSGNAADSGVATLDDVEPTDATAGVPAEGEPTEVDQEQAMLAFAACMRDNGVDIEDPTVDAEGNVQFGGLRGAAQDGEIDREAMRAARDACEEELAGFALGRAGGNFDPTELQDTLLEYAGCMRENGYEMPDPDFSGSGPGGDEPGEGGGGGPFGQLDRDDPDFIAAQEACEDMLGGFAPGRGGGPGQGGGGDA